MAMAPLHETQITYLWSLKFWSTAASFGSHLGWFEKVLLMILVPYLVLLTAVVGPSSALAMVPRPGTKHCKGNTAVHFNGSLEDLYPQQITHSHAMTLYDACSQRLTTQG